jgi:anti-anti-sigma factor
MRADLDGDGSVPFGIDVIDTDGAPVVHVRGEVDVSTTPRFWAGLEQAIGRSERVVVDLSETTFMDAAGLGVLARAARTNGNQLIIRSPNRLVRTLLSVTDVEQVLTIEGGITT